MAVAIQLLFLDKPLHIDDALFVRIARNILQFPLAPFTGPDLFTGEVRQLFIHNNPPLAPAWLAGLLWLGGSRLWFLHLGQIPFVLLSVFSFAYLAAGVCRRPLWPTLLWATNTGFLLTGQHLMADLPALALVQGGTAALVAMKRDENPFWLVVAGLLTGLAIVTKYSMVFFVIYLPFLGFVLGIPASRLVLMTLLAATPMTVWCAHNWVVHGELHILADGRMGRSSPLGLNWMAVNWIGQKAMATLSEIGQIGIFPGLTLFVSLRWKQRRILYFPAVVAGLMAAQLPGYTPWQVAQYFCWAFLGLTVILLCCMTTLEWLGKNRTTGGIGSLELLAWGLLFCAASVVALPFASVRMLLPAVPPMLLLVWLQAERVGLSDGQAGAIVVGGLIFSLAISAADAQYVGLYRGLARGAAEISRGEGAELWFAAEGGLRPELERVGGRYLRKRVDKLPVGSLLAFPVNGHRFRISPKLAVLLHKDHVLDANYSLPFRLESMKARAGFYAHPSGYLPVAFSMATAERLYLMRVGRANPFARAFLEERDKVVVAGAVEENLHQVGAGVWSSFRAHPPSLLRFQLVAEPGAGLEVGFGMMAEISGPRYGDGVTFRVWGYTDKSTDPTFGKERDREKLDDNPEVKGRTLLLESYIDPKSRAEDRRIQTHQIPLRKLVGRIVLELENDCGPLDDCRWDWALWTMPSLIPPTKFAGD